MRFKTVSPHNYASGFFCVRRSEGVLCTLSSGDLDHLIAVHALLFSGHERVPVEGLQTQAIMRGPL